MQLGRRPQPAALAADSAAVRDTPRPSVVAPRFGRRDGIRRRLLAGGDAAGLALGLIAAELVAGHGEAGTRMLLGLATLPVWIVLFKAYGLYDRDIKRVSHSSIDDVPWLFHAFVVGGLLMWLYFKVLPAEPMILEEAAVFAGVAAVCVLALRSAARQVSARATGPERTLIVGGGESSAVLIRKIQAHPEYNLLPVGVLCGSAAPAPGGLPNLGGIDDLDLRALVRAHGVERVMISHGELDDAALVDLVQTCKPLALKVSVVPQLFDAMGPSVAVDDVAGVTVLGINPPVLPRSSRAIKRALDLLVAGAMLVVLALPLLVIALAVKMTSPGPVLFRQRRVGKAGQDFEVLKFRTMVQDAEARREALLAQSSDPNWLKLDSDPRITRVGGVLRMSSLDELPQLWNVVRGEMSLVGPRPLIPSEHERIGGWHRSRVDLTPGITGLWQVLGRTNIPFEEMVKLDYLYVTNWSLWGDIRLILRTLPVVLRRSGAN